MVIQIQKKIAKKYLLLLKIDIIANNKIKGPATALFKQICLINIAYIPVPF